MEQPWRIGLAAAVIAALIGGIVWFSMIGGDDGSTVAATSVAPTTTGGDGSSTTAPTPTTVATSTTTTAVDGSTPTAAALSSEAAILDATDRAVAAWGGFAVTGSLSLVERTFVADGPQLDQLRGEAEALLAEPLGHPPYVFEVHDPIVTMQDPGEAVVAAKVVMTRPGESPQVFDWRIHLHQIDGTWQLWTAEEVE